MPETLSIRYNYNAGHSGGPGELLQAYLRVSRFESRFSFTVKCRLKKEDLDVPNANYSYFYFLNYYMLLSKKKEAYPLFLRTIMH